MFFLIPGITYVQPDHLPSFLLNASYFLVPAGERIRRDGRESRCCFYSSSSLRAERTSTSAVSPSR